MLELEQAVARILAAIPPPVTQNVSLSEADGRVAASNVVSKVDLPPFDNSAMDGYALRAEDVTTAKPELPVKLRLIGKLAAGEVFSAELTPGSCIRIFTGSPLPRGADAVVMQEDARTALEHSDQVLILESVKPWENVRFGGEDVKANATIIRAGERLNSGRLALLAAAGAALVEVGRQPVVGLLATGSELREPGETLHPGQIFESNRLSLASLVRQAGGLPKTLPIVSDVLSTTREMLEAALAECDILVTSGGVSVGEMDFVKTAFEACGGQVEFWRVAIKPGRPFVFGRRGEKFLFGLPGNPVSAFVTCLLLVRPALLRWQGATGTYHSGSRGVLAEPLANPGARRHFMRVRLDEKGAVNSAGPQASHLLSSLAAANGLVDVPANATLLAGTAVQVLCWE